MIDETISNYVTLGGDLQSYTNKERKKLFISSFSTHTDLSLINKCTGIFTSLQQPTNLSFYLHDAEELNCVVLPVIEDLVAEHGAHGVVANVVGNSDPTPENRK